MKHRHLNSSTLCNMHIKLHNQLCTHAKFKRQRWVKLRTFIGSAVKPTITVTYELKAEHPVDMLSYIKLACVSFNTGCTIITSKIRNPLLPIRIQRNGISRSVDVKPLTIQVQSYLTLTAKTLPTHHVPTQSVRVFCIILILNTDYLPQQH